MYSVLGQKKHRVHEYIWLSTDQMAEWYRASASGSVDLGFDSDSGQTNDLKIGIHAASLLDVQHERDSVEKAGKFACCAVGKST